VEGGEASKMKMKREKTTRNEMEKGVQKFQRYTVSGEGKREKFEV
jgi:hypothetical protein